MRLFSIIICTIGAFAWFFAILLWAAYIFNPEAALIIIAFTTNFWQVVPLVILGTIALLYRSSKRRV